MDAQSNRQAGTLPTDLLSKIFEDFDPPELVLLSRVCKSWRRAALNEALWHRFVRKDFPVARQVRHSWRWTFIAARNLLLGRFWGKILYGQRGAPLTLNYGRFALVKGCYLSRMRVFSATNHKTVVSEIDPVSLGLMEWYTCADVGRVAGRQMALLKGCQTLSIWELATGKLVRLIPVDSPRADRWLSLGEARLATVDGVESIVLQKSAYPPENQDDRSRSISVYRCSDGQETHCHATPDNQNGWLFRIGDAVQWLSDGGTWYVLPDLHEDPSTPADFFTRAQHCKAELFQPMPIWQGRAFLTCGRVKVVNRDRFLQMAHVDLPDNDDYGPPVIQHLRLCQGNRVRWILWHNPDERWFDPKYGWQITLDSGRNKLWLSTLPRIEFNHRFECMKPVPDALQNADVCV